MTDSSDDDFSIFKQSVQVDRRIHHDQHIPERRLPKLKRPGAAHDIQSQRQQQAEFYFSETYRAHFPEGPIRFRAEGESQHILKQLRRGDYAPELMLDLHGLTQQTAQREIGALLRACQQQHIDCCAIMSGHGKGILKENLPHWLVQHPAVRAFHQAPRAWGGDAAILVLVKLRD
jgi:DNA-nicking Smr family endonuclease